MNSSDIYHFVSLQFMYFQEDDVWPFYVGTSLAHDKSQCDNASVTNASIAAANYYDECLEKLECNDFTFTIPVSTEPGDYRIIVRFNNVYYIETSPLTVSCNDDICNSMDNGQVCFI